LSESSRGPTCPSCRPFIVAAKSSRTLSAGLPAGRRIEVFLNEAMIVEVAHHFRRLCNRSHLNKMVSTMGADEFDAPVPESDPLIEAALFETIAFLARRDIRRGREAADLLDSTWLDFDTEGDYLLVFDNS